MSELYFTLKHDGGTHRVEIENQGDTTVIRFGASFTLRLDEENLNKLREHIHDAARDMCIERRDTAGVYDREINAESEMVQAGINAREALKAQRMMKGTATPVDWNPNDPANW
jgi:hypothetical protein